LAHPVGLGKKVAVTFVLIHDGAIGSGESRRRNVMTRRPPRTIRRLKLTLGLLIVCRALLAMHAHTFGPTDWPIDARPCAGLLRAAKLLFAGAAIEIPDACEEREIALGPSFGDSL
jgi:hypothetical protein